MARNDYAFILLGPHKLFQFFQILCFIQAGDPKFLEEALKFAYGKDSAALKDGRIQGVQALSGTGGLRVMGELLAKHGHKEIYVPNPTWGNHKAIFTVRLSKYFSILFFFGFVVC